VGEYEYKDAMTSTTIASTKMLMPVFLWGKVRSRRGTWGDGSCMLSIFLAGVQSSLVYINSL
jgi:hypothetical protein